jgi:hypothetical protein
MMNEPLNLLRAGKLAGAKRLDLSCGLREFPREIFDLADSLEVLNLSQNQLSSLPDDLGRLKKLRILFASDNHFTHLPAALGECPQLSMIGFKANQIETVDPAAFPAVLRWLILTDNRIAALPASLGRCDRLQKLMLSGNRLSNLPETMTSCSRLEMVRLASNAFEALPDWLLHLPRLSWLAFAGNPCSTWREVSPGRPAISWSGLEVQQQLGEGASGLIYRANVPPTNRPVAVKVFKGAVTSDGLPASEIAASLAAGQHPNLIEVQARLDGHPSGAEGLVMVLIDPAFGNLAGPPSLDTCTRDVYADGLRLSVNQALSVALGVASAALHLHERGLMHGDLYAHNVLWKTNGQCLLGDLGAAWFYDRTNDLLERVEVRAWGCLLEELVALSEDVPAALNSLLARCLDEVVSSRPTFRAICEELEDMQRSHH